MTDVRLPEPPLPARSAGAVAGLARIVGFLVCVEVASGVLQGYYTPVWKDVAGHLGIRDADVNWFEAAQLIVSALVVPLLARLGDLLGHKRVLLLSTAVTALGSWILALAPSFTTFLVGFAIQGAYVVWLPMEIAIVHRRTAGSGRQDVLTRRAAAVLVGALELSVIIGALTSGALVEATSMPVLLALPAVVVTACLLLVWVGVEDRPGTATGGVDGVGLALVTVVLGLVMAGLVVVRLEGPGSVVAWLLVAAGMAAAWPFVRFEAGRSEPLVDVRLLGSRPQWPVQLAAFLFGMSVLGAQIPLSTFARTDPAVAGYGLGADAAFVSTLIGVYVVALAVGAFTLPVTSRLLGGRGALVLGALLVAAGYAMWLPLHATTGQALLDMTVIALGSGALVAALPAAAAAAAPAERTGFATGMTNATKTVGGALASSVFAIALAATGSLDDPAAGHAPLAGYLTVWSVCAVAALLAAGALLALPGRPRERERSAAGADRPAMLGHLGVMDVPEEPDERRQGRQGPQRDERAPELDARTGRSAAAARMHHQASWVDQQIRVAMAKGEFDDLPGAGKPIKDLGSQHDPDWWLKKLVEREQITGIAPPSVQLRKEDAELDARLDTLNTEDAVRRELEDFNGRVIAARYRLPEGPPLVTMPRDVDDEVVAWRERRTALLERRRAEAAERAAADRDSSARRRRWWRRR